MMNDTIDRLKEKLADTTQHNEKLAQTIGWQRRVLDQVIPSVQAFANYYKGTVQAAKDELNIRILSSGYLTIQIVTRGKGDNYNLEVGGIRRNGTETKHTTFALQYPRLEVDLAAFQKALALVME